MSDIYFIGKGSGYKKKRRRADCSRTWERWPREEHNFRRGKRGKPLCFEKVRKAWCPALGRSEKGGLGLTIEMSFRKKKEKMQLRRTIGGKERGRGINTSIINKGAQGEFLPSQEQGEGKEKKRSSATLGKLYRGGSQPHL